jgi:beta-phosphoglucomutase-like phosphatase (HAD superfamily)
VETHGESVFRYFFDERLDQAFEGADLIVFDMNGLIVNDEGVQLESVNRVLHPYSIHVAREYWINKCVGKRADCYLLQILSENGKIEDAHRVKSLVEEKNRWYEELIADKVTRLVLTGEDVKRSKPDPEIYERLLTLSGIPSYRCLVLEDSGPGVEASHAAGAACIAVPNEYTAKQDFSNASWVISDLTETARILYPIDLGSTL